ncbi:MAG TPA: COX15/CtaA family protein [Stellaceae bacterium]|nr:COX15/CtaA family protein [Stellaceae bacterium]
MALANKAQFVADRGKVRRACQAETPEAVSGRKMSIASPLVRPRDLAARPERAIALWLLVCCGMIFLMVVIGGVTRLTESGLSITEWKPVSGVIPPFSDADWAQEFDRYKAIPQYQAIHADMTLAEFKTIFLWEYLHRLWGRLIGVVFAVPFLWFLWKGRLSRSLAPKLAVIFVLGGLQGALGWFMVESGLADRIEVSQYRLVAHLGAALILYLAILWVALDLLQPWPAGTTNSALRRAASALLGLAFVTLLAGGFVAGLRAGLLYNTFPLMNGGLLPPDFAALAPWYLNPFENPAAAQFDHRVLAECTWLLALVLWLASRRHALSRGLRRAFDALALIATVQLGLGIATLLLVVPIPLAAAHQAGAVALLTAIIVARHGLREAAAPELDAKARPAL